MPAGGGGGVLPAACGGGVFPAGGGGGGVFALFVGGGVDLGTDLDSFGFASFAPSFGADWAFF